MREVTVLTATPLQQEVLVSDKRITILAVGAGAGATYSLYLKAITSKEDHVSMVYPTNKIMEVAWDNFITLFKDSLDFRVSAVSRIITLGTKKIKFTTPSCSNDIYGLRGLLLVDNAHNMPQSLLDSCVNGNFNNMIFTSKPYECAWRDPVYERGVFKGFHSSWDSALVDWVKLTKDCTKAYPKGYKSFVEVVSGYDVYDNLFLLKNNKGYTEFLEALLEKDKERLSGKWV